MKMYRVSNFKISYLIFLLVVPVVTQSMHGYAVALLLGLWVQILLRAQMSVSCDCCVLSGRGSVSVVLLSVVCPSS
jgi:hypothetical protein